jgi:hypothetical protein
MEELDIPTGLKSATVRIYKRVTCKIKTSKGWEKQSIVT